MNSNHSIDVEAERPHFEREMNAQRFFPAELDFTRGKSPSGRDEYVNSHLQSNWNGWLSAKRSIPANTGTIDTPEFWALVREWRDGFQFGPADRFGNASTALIAHIDARLNAATTETPCKKN